MTVEDMVDRTDDERRFFVGEYGLSFGDRRWFVPIPCKGALGFWRLPADVEQRVRGQLQGAAA